MRSIQGHNYSCHFPLHMPRTGGKKVKDTNDKDPVKFNLTNPAFEEDSAND
jgi:hypothetical protein